MILIFDYGHGNNCPGKRSPDKSYYEWKSNREIGKEVAKRMRGLGYTVLETWTEDKEPLSEEGKECNAQQLRDALRYRYKKVNEYCDKYGTKNCIMISFHSNAAGSDHQWHNASGFTAHVGKKASANSKRLARCIYEEAAKAGLSGNRSVPADKCWVQSLAMCDQTKCPAVLTESLFYDNKEDLALLTSDEGKEKIINAHINGIINYLKG